MRMKVPSDPFVKVHPYNCGDDYRPKKIVLSPPVPMINKLFVHGQDGVGEIVLKKRSFKDFQKRIFPRGPSRLNGLTVWTDFGSIFCETRGEV